MSDHRSIMGGSRYRSVAEVIAYGSMTSVSENVGLPAEAAMAAWTRRRALVNSAFTPATPVTNQDLFAGRVGQLSRLLDVTGTIGKHAVVYGERGVGKTSLARVMNLVTSANAISLYYTCSSHEDFGAIWRGILGEARLSSHRRRAGFSGEEFETTSMTAAQLLDRANGSLNPNHARQALETLAALHPVVVVIDEFDRLEDERTRRQFADTIKLLSDRGVNVTLVLVGVGDDVTDLVREHSSIGRHLSQIPMPRMTGDEIKQIVEKGMQAAELGVEDRFVADVVVLAQGLPHYAHLICQHAALSVVDDGRDAVQAADFKAGIAGALNDVSETVRDRYYSATLSNRETIYREVLLACAMAPKDELGTFAPSDVRDQLRLITGHSYAHGQFAAHLRDFSGQGSRGGVLRRTEEGRPRYKFIDPLLPPYVLMRGRADGLLQ